MSDTKFDDAIRTILIRNIQRNYNTTNITDTTVAAENIDRELHCNKNQNHRNWFLSEYYNTANARLKTEQNKQKNLLRKKCKRKSKLKHDLAKENTHTQTHSARAQTYKCTLILTHVHA